MTMEDLTADDSFAISAYLGLGEVRDHETLGARLRELDPTADADWLAERLVGARDLRVVIAAASLRGVEHLPPDPRLRPAPWPLRPSLRPEGAAPAETSYPRDPDEPTLPGPDAVITSVGECAAAPGSKRAERWRMWQVGSTVGELRAAGLRLSDLRRDLSAGRVTLGWAIEATDVVVQPDLAS